MSKKRVEYSDTFKAEAIAKIKENNGNISQTAKDLGIPMNTLAESVVASPIPIYRMLLKMCCFGFGYIFLKA